MSSRVRILYTNWRQQTAVRAILPLSLVFRRTAWHPGRQWILEAIDLERGQRRDFAMSGIRVWKGDRDEE